MARPRISCYHPGVMSVVRFMKRGPALAAVALLPLIVFGPACVRARLAPGADAQTGIASWYGPDFHGRATSSREIYDMNDLTAAHPTLPFGTRVLVTNLDNGRMVDVRINDRGPFVRGRIIDLSYAAARLLDMIGPGTARVRLEIVRSRGPQPPPVRYAVQIGSFALENNARDLADSLVRRYPEVYISTFATGVRTYYRVRIRAADRAAVERLAARLSSEGYPALICETD